MNEHANEQRVRLAPDVRDRVLTLLREGRSSDEIVSELGVTASSISAVKAHLTRGTYQMFTPEGLAQAASEVAARFEDDEVREWTAAVAETIAWVRSADQVTRTSREFQARLWKHNRIARVGQGSISVEAALDDASFREWVAARSMTTCPTDLAGRMAFLREIYEELRGRLRDYVVRTPHLKVFRVLAALFPETMTTVASPRALATLARFLGMPESITGRASRHAWVRTRLDAVLGTAGETPQEQARRMILAWLLYQRVAPDGTDDDEDADEVTPWSAERRRRGLTSFHGYYERLLSTLDIVAEGIEQEDLLSKLAASAPDAKVPALKAIVGALQNQYNVIERVGTRYQLTGAGREVQKTRQADAVRDRLLTRILGPDWVVATLRDEGPLPLGEFLTRLQAINPSLNSDFMPNSIRAWLTGMGVIEVVDGSVRLTAKGAEWAERVYWTPATLAQGTLPPPQPPDPPSTQRLVLPPLDTIVAHVQAKGHFPANVIARLHAALWANDIRHFAVLSGLSGAGKTLLAREYAAAITGESGTTSLRWIIVPVQPGWHDPGALLGYVNPIREDAYVDTHFLSFLLRAASEPSRPYVVVLDEMNLSHPEQYLAPLLSAMETGGTIPLHDKGKDLGKVPPFIAYPRNLVIIGTLNMDETTHGLSDKVLDRAFVVDFWNVDLDQYKWHDSKLPPEQLAKVRQVLTRLVAALEPARMHFGYRVVDEVLRFLGRAAMAPHLPFAEALDDAIYAKVLPKLRGEDTPKFSKALENCSEICTNNDLARSRSKVDELRADLVATGSARFWR